MLPLIFFFLNYKTVAFILVKFPLAAFIYPDLLQFGVLSLPSGAQPTLAALIYVQL